MRTFRVFRVIKAVLGIAIVALPASIITAGYMEEIKEKKGEKHNGEN